MFRDSGKTKVCGDMCTLICYIFKTCSYVPGMEVTLFSRLNSFCSIYSKFESADSFLLQCDCTNVPLLVLTPTGDCQCEQVCGITYTTLTQFLLSPFAAHRNTLLLQVSVSHNIVVKTYFHKNAYTVGCIKEVGPYHPPITRTD